MRQLTMDFLLHNYLSFSASGSLRSPVVLQSALLHRLLYHTMTKFFQAIHFCPTKKNEYHATSAFQDAVCQTSYYRLNPFPAADSYLHIGFWLDIAKEQFFFLTQMLFYRYYPINQPRLRFSKISPNLFCCY